MCLAELPCGNPHTPAGDPMGREACDRARTETVHRSKFPNLRSGQREFFLRLEVMEKASLGQPSRFADIFNPSSGVALGADDLQGRIEKFGFRFVWSRKVGHFSSPIEGPYPPVGMLVNHFFSTTQIKGNKQVAVRCGHKGGLKDREGNGKIWQAACKPNFVEDDHSSRRRITAGARSDHPRVWRTGPARAWQPTPPSFPPIWSCSVWGLPCLRLYSRSGALLPHLFTLTASLRSAAVFSLWHLPSRSLDASVPDVIRHTALRSSDFPLPANLLSLPAAIAQPPATPMIRVPRDASPDDRFVDWPTMQGDGTQAAQQRSGTLPISGARNGKQYAFAG